MPHNSLFDMGLRGVQTSLSSPYYYVYCSGPWCNSGPAYLTRDAADQTAQEENAKYTGDGHKYRVYSHQDTMCDVGMWQP